jgi:hypothetical protein
MNPNPQSVATRPYSKKEINNRNRNITAYNVYSACFYCDYINADTNTKQRQLMIKYGIKNIVQFAAADDDSIVSEPEAAPFVFSSMVSYVGLENLPKRQDLRQIFHSDSTRDDVVGHHAI